MYNPYENNNKPVEGEKTNGQPQEPQRTQPQTNWAQPPVQGSSYKPPENQTETSYTWGNAGNAGNVYVRPPVSYPTPPPPKRKSKAGMRIVALVLCCLISSAAAVGVFVALIQTGVIGIQSSNDNSAFTISKVTGGVQPTTGEVGILTPQQIAQKIIPTVVCIQNFQISNRYGLFGTDTAQNNSNVSPAGEGSGIIMSADGYIITNAHVIDGATSLKVVLSDGQTYEAQVIGADEATDLAVIKIEATGLTPADFGSSDDLAVADQVIAVGNPGGMVFNSSVTVGYVSALNREITSSENGYTMNCIQTDAAINPGNSGGALVNQYGQVVGINSAKWVASGYEGLGFAIPINTAQPILSDLQNYGYVKDRAVLGVSGVYIDAMTAQFNGLYAAGMYVGELLSAQAQSAGLKKHDVITAIDGVKITSFGTISSILATKKPGDTVALTVDRATEQKQNISIELTLSQYEPEETT